MKRTGATRGVDQDASVEMDLLSVFASFEDVCYGRGAVRERLNDFNRSIQDACLQEVVIGASLLSCRQGAISVPRVQNYDTAVG